MRIVAMLLCNIAQWIGLCFVTVLPVTAFSSQPRAMGVFTVPVVALSLLLNESKWIVHALHQGESNIPAVRVRGGLKVALFAFLATSIVAVAVLYQEVSYISMQPLYTQPYDGKFAYAAYLGIIALIAGALASLPLMF